MEEKGGGEKEKKLRERLGNRYEQSRSRLHHHSERQRESNKERSRETTSEWKDFLLSSPLFLPW